MVNQHENTPQHGGDPGRRGGAPGHCASDGSIDLSTGINPWPWPAPALPAEALTLLPQPDADFYAMAAAYYRVPPTELLATGGSQWAIQILPRLASPGRVLMQDVAYEEHRYRWSQAGFEVCCFSRDEEESLASRIREDKIRHLVVVSPNNPAASVVPLERLSQWRQALPEGGLLVVDQAFADASQGSDVSALCGEPGVVILRSLGKFFGLPGLRLGFVLGEERLLQALSRELGPWPVSGPALHLGKLALADRVWQAETREHLQRAAAEQGALLREYFQGACAEIHYNPLFTTLVLPLDTAQRLYREAADLGLWLRLYSRGDMAYLRWGLAADETLLAQRVAALARRGWAAA
ncbi:aminotransferase class I/II-fold pyridoxal phosphate-dependent enzyme [Spongiibacter nanhainus]|uniref:Aminotransferase n=1 Tax=Spongiibacter nanhainus TaxID=2794344 RepID=A0A7T4UNU0_9GAMM|nr:aminotransferase class I/II-fold pyridoxal phosphate-dependent enzyme [Spongiibacter nanhainus]QQD16926.1 aminotransferase class I/II-fold pyridoxal phosphate-dependent enzyme [Spongiibacter nanhainus]